MFGKICSYPLAVLCALALAACGGGGGGGSGGCTTIDPNRDPSLPGCGTTTPSTGKAAVTLTLSASAITAAAPATATAILKDAAGAAVPNTLVTFTSTDKSAVLNPASGGVVTDGSGKATIQVGAGAATTAGGYALTASGTVAGSAVTASAGYSVTQPAATAGQLVFVSALPLNIALKGTGGAGRQESATVSFKVLDASGKAVAGQQVNFTLNTSAGGLTLAPASAVSGGDGVVSTVVSSGTVNTPVRVTAALAGGGVSTLSDQLVVSTGIAEQNSFSLSAAIKNVEGGQFNGCTAPTGTVITARLADHFHNPVPDGTAVSFTAEGGSIDASCLTGLITSTQPDGSVLTQKGTPGECTVRYCAGNPRPADGRVTILAYALGEESFSDANGNNRYDGGETYTDLGDPFRNDRAVSDANANGIDDVFRSGSAVRAGSEQYIDSNGSGAWDQNGNGAYNGVLLATPNVNTGSANTVHVRQALVMVLSNSTPAVTLLDQALNGAPVVGTLALGRCVNGTRFVNDTRAFNFAIRDSNPTVFATNLRSAHAGDAAWLFDRPGNPLPAGTTIQFSSSNGAILGGTSATVQNTSAADSSAWTYSVQMISDAIQDASLNCTNSITNGALTITVTTPNGTVSTFNYPVSD
jgi:hypothetical protein